MSEWRTTAAHDLWYYYNITLGVITPIDVVLDLIDAGVVLIQELSE